MRTAFVGDWNCKQRSWQAPQHGFSQSTSTHWGLIRKNNWSFPATDLQEKATEGSGEIYPDSDRVRVQRGMQCTHQSRPAIKVLLPRSIKQHFTATDVGWGISCGRGWIYGLQTNNSTGRRGDAFDLFVPSARNFQKDPIPLIHGHLSIHMWIRLRRGARPLNGG